MVPVSACPDARQWQRLLLGEYPDHDAEQMEQHLAGCSRCLETVRGLPVEHDTMIEAMRAQPTPPDPDASQTVERLIGRLKGMALTGETTEATCITPGQTPMPDVCDFLAPARGPGEIGRLGPYGVVKVLGVGG